MVTLKLLSLTIFVQVIVFISKISPASPSITRGRIVNGLRAKVGQFPWHAHLKINGHLLCGGSLIKSTWVVTAAHCIYSAKKVVVRLGIINSVESKVKLQAKSFNYHENFSFSGLVHDIGLVELPEPAPTTKLIQEIRMVPKSLEDKIAPDLTGTVCGFGRMDDNNNNMPTVLLWLEIGIISNEKCREVFDPDYITEQKFCADGINATQNICDGDSGGGLVVEIGKKKYLAGITSFGREGTCSGAPSGYEKVTPYLDWIDSKTKPSNSTNDI